MLSTKGGVAMMNIRRETIFSCCALFKINVLRLSSASDYALRMFSVTVGGLIAEKILIEKECKGAVT